MAKPKANSVVMVERLDDGRISVAVLNAGTLAFDPTKASRANREYAEFHGWKQRLADAAAISRDDETGRPASPEDKLNAIRARIEHYESGSDEWSMVGGGGGGKSLTIEAIALVKDIDYEAAQAIVARYADEKYDGDTRKALAYLRQGERVARAMETIRAERTPEPKLDADEALDELGAE